MFGLKPYLGLYLLPLAKANGNRGQDVLFPITRFSLEMDVNKWQGSAK
jgi:hypothetical protein